MGKGMMNSRNVAKTLTSVDWESLSAGRRFSIRMHLWMCQHCRRFRRQLKQMSEAVRHTFSTQPISDDELSRRILERLGLHE